MQKIHGAIEFARGCIPNPKNTPQPPDQREIALHCARLLLKYGNAVDWPNINRLITEDTDFGRALIEGASSSYFHDLSSLVRTLSETDIGALWEWMQVQYPVANDPPEKKSGRGGTITTPWAMAEIRDRLIYHLAELGTPMACDELHRIAKKYPDLLWIQSLKSRGLDQLRRNSWQPPSPEELFRLSENQSGRLVHSSEQLFDVVCIAVEDLQQKLHGETPAAQFLWNKDRPMKEEAISDWIKIELETAIKQKGIVLNREVQIHIRERTDIHVGCRYTELPKAGIR